MAYKWKPSASQRRAFAERMKDPEEQIVYNQRKEDKADKRRATSQYNYNSAGGNYVPTTLQYDTAMIAMQSQELTPDQQDACNHVIYGYNYQEKINHDHIHVVNELFRNRSSLRA